MSIVDLLRVNFELQDLAALLEVTPPVMSRLVREGHIDPDGTALDALRAYTRKQRAIASGRGTAQAMDSDDDGTVNPALETALLKRAQREGQEIKNKVALGQFAPVELLTDVLATAAQGAIDRLEMIPAEIAKNAPDISQKLMATIDEAVVSARNEIAKKAESLAVEAIDAWEESADE